MKIRELQLKNIGVFDDEKIKFQPCPKDKAEIHIFTGQNGSGKTTILQALVCRFDYFAKSNVTLAENCHPLPNKFHKRFRENSSVLIVSDYFGNGNHLVKTRLDSNENYLYPVGFQEEQSPSDYWVSSFSKGEPYDNDFSYRFAPFALSGYRHIEAERIDALKEPKGFNPLAESLEFVKDYSKDNQITINQLITNNISKSAIEKDRNNIRAEKFANVIKSISQIISEITDWKVEFDLETEPINLLTKINGVDLDFDVLPDGLSSLISWIADLLGKVDLLKWDDNLPIFEKNLILLLDEIEVHLHPAWQRKVLPVVQKLFKNSQIFVSTHSPFVVNSVDDAWVYKLELKSGKARVGEIVESENSNSITQVLREVFGIEEWFGLEVQNNFERFKELKNKIISNGADENVEKELLEKAKILADEPNDQLKQIIRRDLEELSEIKNKPYVL